MNKNISGFKIYIPKTEHEALKEYYRANESASHKRIRRALARLILKEDGNMHSICNLSENRRNDKRFTVIVDNMTEPVASFSCPHCAEEWGNMKFPGSYKIEPADLIIR